jgi:hypothetical protein
MECRRGTAAIEALSSSSAFFLKINSSPSSKEARDAEKDLSET